LNINFNQFKDLINRKIQAYDTMSLRIFDHELGLILQTKVEMLKKVKKWMDEVK
jgi:hypothetical protein